MKKTKRRNDRDNTVMIHIFDILIQFIEYLIYPIRWLGKVILNLFN
ncbi:hypothetical protein JOC74_000203 [Bacillus capparidis]|uniref:Uncharacterized protein n=1 Tax=Bacillus capparidis TaxID=1840411 RepID=A0ABS4CQ55_9BACI|nr:hypothetical protein [Bacillus capparidis]